MTKHSKRLGIALGLVAVLGGALWWEARKADEGSAATASGLRAAPLFELKRSNGQIQRLADLKGNAVVLHFWASWCPPCLGEIQPWLELAAHWKGKPVKFLAVSLDKSWAEALKILPDAQLPENTISVLDDEGTLPDRYGTYQYPETYLLSPDLKIVAKWVGPQNWESPGLASAIESAAATQPQQQPARPEGQ